MSTILDAMFCHDAQMIRACARHEEEQIRAQEELNQRALDQRIDILRKLCTSPEECDQFIADHEIEVFGKVMTGESFGHFMLHELAWAYKDGPEVAAKRFNEIWASISDHIDAVAEAQVTE